MKASIRLPQGMSSPWHGRHFVRDRLLEWGLQGWVDVAALLTSELVTNAVVHAWSDAELAVVSDGRTVWVGVTDHGTGNPEVAAGGELDEGGRGLGLVSALADDWGVTPASGGKTVWFQLT